MTLPDPQIVETEGVLGGRPRIDGTRIGVEHILETLDSGYTVDEISTVVYPHLTLEHVNTAVEWAERNPERMEKIREQKRKAWVQHALVQCVVDTLVEESMKHLRRIFSSNDESRLLRPVASCLRNGLLNADGLTVSTDIESCTVSIRVDEELLNEKL